MSKTNLNLTLYRSLLKASKPFCSPSPTAKVYSCLLTSRIDADSGGFTTRSLDSEGVEHERLVDQKDEESCEVFFQQFLREIVSGSPHGHRVMQFPSQVNPTLVCDIIQREFRSTDCPLGYVGRVQIGFKALKCLNDAHAQAKSSEKDALDTVGIRERNEKLAALDVSPLPYDPAECLKPGAFLVAHPLVTGRFRRAVVCIVDQKVISPKGDRCTYGLVVNRALKSSESGKECTLQDVIRHFPTELGATLGSAKVRDGGPAHLTLQMIYASAHHDVANVGGHVLSMLPDGESSTALNTDRAVYLVGDVVRAAEAMQDGTLQPDDIRFFAGCCLWEPGQLEREIERGIWIPCRGPPEIVLTGECTHRAAPDASSSGKYGNGPCLWLSMLSACGQDEASLAHLFVDNPED